MQPAYAPLAQAPMQAMQTAFACPLCGAPAAPSLAPVRCSGCAGSFVLYPGYAFDPSIVPPPPSPGVVNVRWSEVFTIHFGKLESMGVGSGTNDPVTGLIALEQSGVLFPDVVSITIWRTIRWVQLIAAVVLLVPLAALFTIAAVTSGAGFAFGSLFFGGLAAWAIYQAAFIKANHARVVGRYRMLQMRFDNPFWRRRRFHDELLRRSGLPPAPIP